MKKVLIFVFVLAAIVASFFIFSGEKVSAQYEATMYKSPSCGCCVKYAPYVEDKGIDVNTVATEGIENIKQQYGVPTSMESCHTMVIEGYFVEGHIPKEAIDKLLLERPDIDGIALPGMPAGSPGMPGTKNGDFIIYSIKDRNVVGEFMRI